MAKYSSKDLTVTVGGHDVTQYLLTVSVAKLMAIIEDATRFGDTWQEAIATGIKKLDKLQLGGFYDDTATTGPDALMGPSEIGSTVAVVVTWGGSKTSTFNAIVDEYDRTPAVNKMTRFMASLTPTGTVTEA